MWIYDVQVDQEGVVQVFIEALAKLTRHVVDIGLAPAPSSLGTLFVQHRVVLKALVEIAPGLDARMIHQGRRSVASRLGQFSERRHLPRKRHLDGIGVFRLLHDGLR